MPKDSAEAFKWMQKASQNMIESSQVSTAMYELALMCEKGDGSIPRSGGCAQAVYAGRGI